MSSPWGPPQTPYSQGELKPPRSSARKRTERIGYIFYLSLFVLAPIIGWGIGDIISPLVTNPDYDPTSSSEVIENCYLNYDSPSGPYETCDYGESNPKLIRKFGNPELFMFLTFWGAVFCLPPLKRVFLRRIWNRTRKGS